MNQQLNMEPGRVGAMRQTWRKDNPRSMLRTMIAANPNRDEAKIHQMFWDEIQDDKQLLRACVEYWLDNNYRSLILTMNETPVSRASKKKAADEITSSTLEKLNQRIAAEVKLKLLDLIMPNNKKLGDCTGAECRRFRGWLVEIAKRVPAKATVRKMLSEEQIRKIWNSET